MTAFSPIIAECAAPAGWMFVGPYIVPLPRRVLISEIQTRVARHYGIPIDSMRARGSERRLSWPRQVAMYLCRLLTASSLPEIGRRFGGRDHATVIHAIRSIEIRRENNAEIEQDLRVLIAALEGLR